MKFLLHQPLPPGTGSTLQAAGYDVVDPGGAPAGKTGKSPDPVELLAQAQAAGAVLLSGDKDLFYHPENLPRDHGGIVVVALTRSDAAALVAKVKSLSAFFKKTSVACKRILIDDDRVYLSGKSGPG